MVTGWHDSRDDDQRWAKTVALSGWNDGRDARETQALRLASALSARVAIGGKFRWS